MWPDDVEQTGPESLLRAGNLKADMEACCGTCLSPRTPEAEDQEFNLTFGYMQPCLKKTRTQKWAGQEAGIRWERGCAADPRQSIV